MTTEKLNTKIELTEAAIDLYIEDKFSIPNLTDKTGKTASEIYALFPNKKSILQFYYPSLVIRYRAMIGEIEDFDSYTIAEKLSNFCYTLFDMMDDRRAFVEDTFEKYEWKCTSNTEFRNEIKDLFTDFFTTDGRIATSAGFIIGDLFYSSLRTQYLFLVKFWLEDESEDKERTFALVDKLTGFIEELVYSKIVDKGFDLAKYSVSAFGFSQQVEDFNEWVSSWFEDEHEVEVEITDEEDEETEDE
ncbi:TetR family transcriptional regulator C-terminal domain-containing protein [Gracilimonas sediminicola]|uniref:TetR family transcriptional regulator C-terminal domain-containing protein n=1 Tax=Gracilimonas sediminicola TaxID=2952158 RepID=A0A9X2L222_9BACT|nr:TetR family transcriptional regulator C-terminal domain-containing protein [Gracilimonas sediminicola]MCP9290865.1 TetR family transcriptional regulator C-terminal domain-containing protein [Gracilimonas sediminicola]